MAVTKATYTATATWTASQLAAIFESAFIASGHMTAWYDSFLSGSVENRILEITYNGSKTYGKTYYWFMFTTTEVRVHYATGWNAGSDVPTGTQYLDYFSTTTNSTGNHFVLLSVVSTTNVTLTRFTSGATSSHSWFALAQGSSSVCFAIPPAAHAPASWIDLDKVAFTSFLVAAGVTSSNAGYLNITTRGALRRSHCIGSALNGNTSSADYTSSAFYMGISYASVGRVSNSFSNNSSNLFGTNRAVVLLPTADSTTNPAYSGNYSPIFTGLPYSFYIPSFPLPNDFGVYFHYANNTMVRGDKIIVSAGVEEWEILAVTNNATVTSGASPCFLARVVG